MKNIFKVDNEKNIGALIISILIAEGLGFIAGAFTANSKVLYSSLKKPFFSPPSFIFPIVWGILYALMAIAAYRIWLWGKKGKPVKRALRLYGTQLILNFIWPFIFFMFRLYGLAFIELIILIIFIILTTIEFFNIDKVSGILMLPYLIWTIFAAVLNYFIWMLNEM